MPNPLDSAFMTDPTDDSSQQCICAVIVCYFSELDQLTQLLSRVSPQVEHILLIDNSASETGPTEIESLIHQYPHCHYLPQTSNSGVAKGYNQGAEWAKTERCSHILLLDQDSLPAPDMVEQLIKAKSSLNAQRMPIAALAPSYTDARNPAIRSTFRQSKGFRIKRIDCSLKNDTPIEMDQAISSGSLIQLDTFEKIGAMDERFFIDLVDTEWVLRAKALGYVAYGVCSATMTHQIGDRFIRLPLIKRNVALHSPLRLYYLVRNSLFLYSKPHVPILWAARDSINLVAKLTISLLFSQQRLRQFKMMFKGLKDGIMGKGGVHPESLDKP